MSSPKEDLAQALQANQLGILERAASTAIAASILAREALEHTVEQRNESLQGYIGESVLTWANEVYIDRDPETGLDTKEVYVQEVKGKFAGLCIIDGSQQFPNDGQKKLVESGLADRLLRVGLVIHPNSDTEDWVAKRVPLEALEDPVVQVA